MSFQLRARFWRNARHLGLAAGTLEAMPTQPRAHGQSRQSWAVLLCICTLPPMHSHRDMHPYRSITLAPIHLRICKIRRPLPPSRVAVRECITQIHNTYRRMGCALRPSVTMSPKSYELCIMYNPCQCIARTHGCKGPIKYT